MQCNDRCSLIQHASAEYETGATDTGSSLGSDILANPAFLVRSPGWGSVRVQSCTDDCMNELATDFEDRNMQTYAMFIEANSWKSSFAA